jgi:Cation transport ATPase
VARKSRRQGRSAPADLPKNLVLLGLIGLLDPPRKEAIEAVKECHRGGIRVTMITGDHKITAAAIAKMLGIGDGKTAIAGAEIEDMNEAALQEKVRDVDVFARASPEHKLRLVKAIQANRQIVAMTGDGVNDAPALKKADIGVAMGIKGTEVTKEAAGMVLADDNFCLDHGGGKGRAHRLQQHRERPSSSCCRPTSPRRWSSWWRSSLASPCRSPRRRCFGSTW